MKRENVEQFIRSVFQAQEQEILCSEFFERLPRFVDLEAAGADAAATMPEVQHHFGQCPECREVYQALLHALRPDRPADIP